MEFSITRFLWNYYLIIGVAKKTVGGEQKVYSPPNRNATNGKNNNYKASCFF